jgi:hypothetical protein
MFCDNNAGSREHLWPKWIHERRDFGPLNFQLGNSERKVIPDPEIKVKTVCGVCNNGWMSALESESIPTIGNMLHNISISLDEAQQKSVAAWTVKTAMVGESMKGREAPNQFYNRDERAAMRISRDIPPRTLIWIARMDAMHLGDFGTDFALFNPQKERIGMGSVTTVVAGHFVTQVVTVHVEKLNTEIPQLPCKMGNWNASLVQIWPIQKSIVQWPPKVSFTSGGPHGLAYLSERWRMGQKTGRVDRAQPSK